ncbi:hypothetical protein ESCO47_00085 [Escherichia phage vB_EcoM_ESCO47]|nr:hypothetical protein ESCO47_00085 [Escherichia phage vB_EcoM_ESCO47]
MKIQTDSTLTELHEQIEELGLPWFEVPIYDFTIVPLTPEDEDVASEIFEDVEIGDSYGVTLSYSSVIVLTINLNESWVNTLAHEIVHIKNSIAAHKGIKWCVNNDEAEAYLVGWLSEQLFKFYTNRLKTVYTPNDK